MQGGNPPWNTSQIQGPPKWCGHILGNNQSHYIPTLQGGNPSMNIIPQWSGEVPKCNQSFWNQPAIPVFDPAKPPHGPYSNGMNGSIKNLEQITQQMGQFFVQTSEPIVGQEMQQHAKASPTSEILTVPSMDLGGERITARVNTMLILPKILKKSSFNP